MFRAQNHITLDLIKIPLNKQTGGEPISPIHLKPFKLVITYIYPTIFYRKWFKT